MAGERQEDVVQGGPAQPEVVDAHAHLVEPADRLDDRPGAPADGQAHGVLIDARRLVGHRLQRPDGGGDRAGIGEMDLEALAADAILELVGRPLGDHAAAVDHRDRIGQAVGLFEVLRGQQHRRALRDQPLDRRPHLQTAARVKAGRRLVEEEHGRPGDERRREVEPAPHAAGVGLGRAVGGVHEVEALQQLLPAPLRHRPALAVEAAHHHEVLQAGEVLVDGRVLPGQADPAAQLDGVADDVQAGHPHGAGIGLEQRGQHPHRGRLAGAVGAQQPEHAARRRVQIDAVEGPDVAEGLLQAGHADRRLARVHAVHDRHGRKGLGQIVAAITGMLGVAR